MYGTGLGTLTIGIRVNIASGSEVRPAPKKAGIMEGRLLLILRELEVGDGGDLYH
jgi:hypothetical protein